MSLPQPPPAPPVDDAPPDFPIELVEKEQSKLVPLPGVNKGSQSSKSASSNSNSPVVKKSKKKKCDKCGVGKVAARVVDDGVQFFMCKECTIKLQNEREEEEKRRTYERASSSRRVLTVQGYKDTPMGGRKFGRRKLAKKPSVRKLTGKDHLLDIDLGDDETGWCTVCWRHVWAHDGLIAKTCSNDDCSCVVHESCLDAVEQNCPVMPHPTDGYQVTSGGLFGVELDKAVLGRRNKLPIVVEDAVEFLVAKALDEEGILRMSGSFAEIQRLKKAYDSQGDIEFGQDVHTAAGILKLFFRELDSALIPDDFNEAIGNYFSETREKYEDKLKQGKEMAVYLHHILRKLPDENFEVIRFLCYFFIKVIQHKAHNKMSENNVLLCILPSLESVPAPFLFGIRHFGIVFDRRSSEEVQAALKRKEKESQEAAKKKEEGEGEKEEEKAVQQEEKKEEETVEEKEEVKEEKKEEEKESDEGTRDETGDKKESE